MAELTAKSILSHGLKQHAHMLGAGAAYFEAKFPAEWADLRNQPAETAIPAMRARLAAG